MLTITVSALSDIRIATYLRSPAMFLGGGGAEVTAPAVLALVPIDLLIAGGILWSILASQYFFTTGHQVRGDFQLV